MRTVIAGGRDYTLTEKDWATLDWLRETIPITEVVSGGAKGADAGGEEWAASRGIEVYVFPFDWESYGNRAGPIRNDRMAKFAQAVILFPGGRGTDNMQGAAERHGCVVFDFRDGIPDRKEIKVQTKGKRKLNREKVQNIRKRLREGAKMHDLAVEYGVSKVMIYKIKERIAWAEV